MVFILELALISLICKSSMCISYKNVKPNDNNDLVNAPDVYSKYYGIYLNTKNYRNRILEHFWKSTGLCPPYPHDQAANFLLGSDMKQNLAILGSLPLQGIKNVRVHWLLDLVSILNKDSHGSSWELSYNFTNLDLFLEVLNKSDLVPQLELMGNPANHFSDFENLTQIQQWQHLITATVSHLIDIFGEKAVSSWNFETWNEANNKVYNTVNFTSKGFLNYFDATWNGLKSISKTIKLGGPAMNCPLNKNSSFCWQLLNHCSKNAEEPPLSDGHRCLDFISIHQKGDGHSKQILEGELRFLNTLAKNFISLKYTPFFNDEADPLVNWAKPHDWRADATYAAMVVKIITQHVEAFFGENHTFNFKLLSNDNGFMSYFPNQFTQRTLLARFQMNNTNPPYTVFIQKPVYSAMGLLAKLGHTLLNSVVTSPSEQKGLINSFSTVLVPETPSETGPEGKTFELGVVISHSNDTSTYNSTAHIRLDVVYPSYLETGDLSYMLYQVDNMATNPYELWSQNGKPSFPPFWLFKQLQKSQGPHLLGGRPTILPAMPCFQIKLKLPLPGILLAHFCNRNTPPPKKIQQIQALLISSHVILLTWKDMTRCLWTYEIEISQRPFKKFFKIHNHAISFPSFYHFYKGNLTQDLAYRVRSVDYWYRKSPFSDPILIKH